MGIEGGSERGKPSSSHITEQHLEAYAANQLLENELDRVEEHLLVCTLCQDQLDLIERFGRAMRAAAAHIRDEEKQAREKSWLKSWLRNITQIPVPAWAGAAGLAVILLMVSLPFHFPNRRPVQPPGPPVEVTLESARGDTKGTAAAGHALHLVMDGEGITELPDWKAEIVDDVGWKMWNGAGKRSGDVILADVPQSFSPGTYFVRLYKPAETDPAREFKLVVQ